MLKKGHRKKGKKCISSIIFKETDCMELMQDALHRIMLRESIIQQLRHAIETTDFKDRRKRVNDLLDLVRASTMETVEAIQNWKEVRRVNGDDSTFRWRGIIYLVKIPSDLDFVSNSRLGPRIESSLGFALYRNPLVMPFALGEAEKLLPSEDDTAAALRVWEMDLQRVKRTEKALLEAEKQYGVHIQDEHGIPITPAAATALLATIAAANASRFAIEVSGWKPPLEKLPRFRNWKGEFEKREDITLLDSKKWCEFLRHNGMCGDGIMVSNDDIDSSSSPTSSWGGPLAKIAFSRFMEDEISGAQYFELNNDDLLDLGVVPSLRERLAALVNMAHIATKGAKDKGEEKNN